MKIKRNQIQVFVSILRIYNNHSVSRKYYLIVLTYLTHVVQLSVSFSFRRLSMTVNLLRRLWGVQQRFSHHDDFLPTKYLRVCLVKEQHFLK